MEQQRTEFSVNTVQGEIGSVSVKLTWGKGIEKNVSGNEANKEKKKKKNWHQNGTSNNLLAWDKYFRRSAAVMQARHTILTLDMTFKEPLVIKEGFCQCKMGFDCTATTQSL